MTDSYPDKFDYCFCESTVTVWKQHPLKKAQMLHEKSHFISGLGHAIKRERTMWTLNKNPNKSTQSSSFFITTGNQVLDTLPILYHGLEVINIDLLSNLPWLNINNVRYKQTYNTVCSVFVYVDLYVDVNLTKASSLDTKDWNMLFFSAYWYLYVYCVYVVYRVKCCRPVSLYLFYPFRLPFLLNFSWAEFYLPKSRKLHRNAGKQTVRFPADRRKAGRHTEQNSAGWWLAPARHDSRGPPTRCCVGHLIPPSNSSKHRHITISCFNARHQLRSVGSGNMEQLPIELWTLSVWTKNSKLIFWLPVPLRTV